MSNLQTPLTIHQFAWKRRSMIILMLWTLVVVHSLEEEPCPVECQCLGNVVDCNGLQLVAAPSELPSWTEVLDLSGNKLGDNFTVALSDVIHLDKLTIAKNHLTQVPYLHFIKNLTQLNLSHNLIPEINGDALSGLTRLERLEMNGNRLTGIPQGTFLAPNRLTHLNLNMNQISVIQNGSLDNLTLLKELRLNKNRITHFKDLFKNLGNLRILEMNRNDLEQIQGLSFRGLKNLEELRLKRNKIRTLDDGAFWPLKNLVLLQLDYNLLSVVKKGALFELERLQKLTLSHNRINKIEPLAWDTSKEIKELDLSHNQLTSIDRGAFEYLEKLENLKLDHNQIAYISDSAFSRSPNLQVLELNWNLISSMVEEANGVFDSLERLSKLGLAHNRIQSISNHAFAGLSQVTELDLTGNNVTNIEKDAFAPMVSLAKLKMNSRMLVCDCELQWLSIWLQEHRYSDTKVHCGYPHWLHGMPLTQLHHSNFTCDEFPKPRIIEEPRSQMSIKGDNVTLVCRASSTADAPLQFLWKHNNVELRDAQFSTDNDSLELGVTKASSILHLTNVTYDHEGKYQCIVSNTYGTTYSSKAKISIMTYPSFSTTPRDMEVTAGKTVRLECSAEGEPPPQIAWQKDGGNDFPAARERRMRMMSTDGILFIVDVKMADSGVYSCTAQNLAGVIIANATLTILEIPSFVKPMENKEITIGSSIVLECMASGSPRPKLSWRKNGSPLQTTERHFFTAENQLLIIVNTTASDEGTYECEMSNSKGSVIGASHLTVNPAPNPVMYDDEILGLIIITVVCCAIGTSIIWVIIIYQTRRKLNTSHNTSTLPSTTVIPAVPGAQTHLYLDTSSQHSKDSGTGDSTNPSNDQLQLCLPEEIVSRSVNNEDETGAINIGDPLLRYTNHERHVSMDENDCAPP